MGSEGPPWRGQLEAWEPVPTPVTALGFHCCGSRGSQNCPQPSGCRCTVLGHRLHPRTFLPRILGHSCSGSQASEKGLTATRAR